MSTQTDEIEIKQASSEEAECPSCGGSFEFNPSTSNLKCPYCDFEAQIADPETEQAGVVELDFSGATDVKNFDWGAEKKSVVCGSCGAEAIYDALEVANVCPYCDSNQLMEASAEGALSPNGVVTFEVTKQQASEKFITWIKGKWFTPREAKEKAKPDGFQGVYLPHWTFDTQTAARYTADYGINRTTTDKDGNRKTTIDWYKTSGLHQKFVDDHAVLATNRHDEKIMSSIRPFNTDKAKPYQSQYFSGFSAERYSVGLEQGWTQAQKEIDDILRKEITDKVKAKFNADHVNNVKLSATYSDVKYKYLMLPIWISSFKFKNKVYHFAVNGQTGKVGGQAPISPLRVAIAIIAGIAVVGGFLYFSDFFN